MPAITQLPTPDWGTALRSTYDCHWNYAQSEPSSSLVGERPTAAIAV